MKKTLLSVATVTALTGVASSNISAADYTVESGDTLWGLATEHGTTVSALKEVNGLSSDLIIEGEQLSLDEKEEVKKDETAGDGTYVIQPGDTLFKIGQKFNVDYQQIMEWNNLSSDLIFAGKTLIVSGNAAPAVQEQTEVVEAAPAVEEQTEVVETAPAVEETVENQTSSAVEQTEANQAAAEQRAAEQAGAEQAAAAEQAEAEQTTLEQPSAPAAQQNNDRAAEQAEAERQQRIEQREAEQAKAQKQEAEQAQSQQVSNVGGNAASVAHSVAAGKSYVYGANTSTAVDCSALSQQFMKAFKGVNLPRTAAGQMAAGTQVSNPQPGDLVFFNGGSHVGIYIGNGQMVDALNPSEGVGQRAVSYVHGSIDGYFRY
ncbi:LysM peptidoglycan-binding domain-containing protein [Salinicoccus siamensis]|uniref:LysM peptidoglycan-binding domain-containing protein n=1 Tax=Salinicoccus siamensis TaxID=381830 RepID=A0ABV5Z671_9STAP